MQFNSIPFIFYFLPLFLAVYHIVPSKARAAVLSAGSVVFYGLVTGWDVLSLAVLAAAVVLAYVGGLAVERWNSGLILGVTVMYLAGVLVFFKLWLGGILLPVGMSFYVFQLISYVADVRMKKLTAERNFISFCAWTVMFPKLLSGPVTPNAELRKSTLRPRRKPVTVHMGLQEFILGLSLKVLLANRLGGVWGQGEILGFETVSTPYAWLALITFCMRLYFDFYGYSLMAVGLGHMLGYNLPMNFLEPYSSRTVSDFFRRWHATLGRWFRDYIYIPLGGNRRGLARTLLNLAVVWALTGFWHGVDGGYMLWAGILFLLIANEKLWMGRHLDKSRVLSHIYVVIAIILSWVPFAAESIPAAITVYGRLFAVGGVGDLSDFISWAPRYAVLLVAGLIFATPIPRKLWSRIYRKWYADALVFVLFWVCVFFIATSAQDTFIYFSY